MRVSQTTQLGSSFPQATSSAPYDVAGNWLGPARSGAAGLASGHGDLSVELRGVDSAGGVLLHHLMFIGGRLHDWAPGHASTPDLVLRQPLSSQLSMLTRVGLGEGLLKATEVLHPRTGAWVLPPPLDEVRSSWGRDLPAVPVGPDLLVQQTLIGSPFGAVATWFRIVRGQVVASGVGSVGEADVRITRHYALALAERRGELDLLDSLEGGELEGDEAAVMALAGGYEADEVVNARRALTTPAERPLAALGNFLCSTQWEALASRVAAAAAASE